MKKTRYECRWESKPGSGYFCYSAIDELAAAQEHCDIYPPERDGETLFVREIKEYKFKASEVRTYRLAELCNE